jgi:phage tail-like protein
MATAERKDPFPSFNFAVEIHGIVSAGFSEVSGLQAEITVQEYQEGGVNDYVHKFWGPAKYPANLVLKRGITDTTDLWSWYCDVMRGKVQRKEVSVVLMNSAGEEQRRWTFQNAYPVKWAGPGMRATASEVAVETLELAHEGLKEWRQK